MKTLLVKMFGASWETSVAGYGSLVCGGTALSGIIPEKYNVVLGAICTILIAFGLVRAKDGNVSNAPVPKDPTKVGG